MLATPPLPRLCSAGDLCKAVLSAGTGWEPADAGLDRTLCHDAGRSLLEVQAGVPWSSLAAYVGAEFLPGTVGQSFAANRPGPDGEPVVRHLRCLTLASAGGELVRASRDQAAELFRLAVGGFGAFGPFYSLTLDLASLARSAASAVAPARLEFPEVTQDGRRVTLELLLPQPRSEAAVAQVRTAVEEHRCRLRRLEARRIMPEAETFLRWARADGVLLHIEYCAGATLGACASAAQLRGRLLDLAVASGGGFMPAMLPLATRAQAAAAYPMLGAFLAEKRRLDPVERLASPWYRGVRRAWRAESCRVRWAKD